MELKQEDQLGSQPTERYWWLSLGWRWRAGEEWMDGTQMRKLHKFSINFVGTTVGFAAGLGRCRGLG